MTTTFRFLYGATLALCLIGFSGCGDKGGKTEGDDHDHAGHDHDDEGHADTYKDALANVVKNLASLKAGFENEDMSMADKALHDIMHPMQDLEEIVEKSEMADDAKEAVNAAVESLYASLEVLHDQMHHSGDEGTGEETEKKTYADVADAIDAAVKTLTDNDK